MANLLIDPDRDRRRIALLSILMFAFLFVLALVPGLKAVEGLTWGASVDFHRDASFVRAMVEGHYGEDPTYLGGAMWYTPLVGTLEAAVVWLTGHSVDQVIVQMGAYTNLLVPIAFFIMLWYFFGPVRAVLGSAVFLFFTIGHEPGWALPTYSPRLIPVSFCQWFLYIEVIFIDRAFRSTRIMPSLIAGIGAGVTFLAHAAPALLSVLIIFLFTMNEVVAAIRRKDGTYGWPRLRASIVAGTAFIITSLPLTSIVVGEYGMKVVNRSYFLYNYYGLTLHEKEVFFYHNISLINVLALIGAWLVYRRRIVDTTGRAPMARRILLVWFVLSILLMVYSYCVAVLDQHYGIHLPGILPPFHFYFYMKAAMAVFAGLAVWHGGELLAKRLRPAWASTGLAASPKPVLWVFGIVAVACTLNYPAYATRRDVFAVRNRNLAFMERTHDGNACVQINKLLRWDDVMLCDHDLSVWPLLPSARKVVATTPTMGNPYLDQSHRGVDRDSLMAGMRAPRSSTAVLMEKYKVTHFLVRTGDLATMPEASKWFHKEVFREGDVLLLAR
ncbi:MAG: hypothetical protein ABI599_11655 [Flavobacteriales bacterium]